MSSKGVFKKNSSKPKEVDRNDPYITANSLKRFCGIFGHNGSQPQYIDESIDMLVDFEESFYEDISKVQMIRENNELEADQKATRIEAKKEAAELRVKRSLDTKVSAIMGKHKYFVKRPCPVRIPYKSTLNHAEHKAYLRGFIKFQISSPITSHEQQEYDDYIGLQNRVFSEQNCLMNFSQSVARLQLENYNSIPDVINSYLSDHISHRCKRVQKYPQYYTLESEIPLRPQNKNNYLLDFFFDHIGHLLSIGQVPFLQIPNPHMRFDFPRTERVREKRKPDCDTLFNKKQFLFKCPVSEDPNAIYLAKEHKVSIVLSASTFKKLVDNQDGNFDKKWDIPTIVRSYDIDGSSHRIVFLDKPFIKLEWTPLQKKHLFYKVSAIEALTKICNDSEFKFEPAKEKRELPAAYDDDIFNLSSEIIEGETFGVDYSPKPRNEKKEFQLDNGKNGKKRTKVRLRTASAESSNTEPELQIDASDSSQDNSVLENEGKNKQSSDDDDMNCKSSLRRSSRLSISSSKESSKNSSVSPNLSDALLGGTSSIPKSGKFCSPRSSSSAGGVKTKSIHAPVDILNNILGEQNIFLKPTTPSQKSKSRADLPNNFTQYQENSVIKNDDFNKKPWHETCPTNWQDFNIKECPKNGKLNVHYQLFTLGNSKSTPGKSFEPIRVLVRHNIHGLTRFKKEKFGKSKAFVIYPKIENQVFFGCEVNTLSEITRQWADLAVRPNTCLLHTRLCSESGSLVMSDERTLSNILKEGKHAHIKFNPQSALASLNAIFHSILRMPSGNYLLHHSQKTKAFIELLRACDKVGSTTSYNTTFDLHSCYDGTMITQDYNENSIPWLAIDTHVLTPFHLLHSKVPATFPMDNPDRKKGKMSKADKMKRRKQNPKKSLDDLA